MKISACFNSKGFTLIELLVTVSILSILTIAVIPGFGNFAESSAIQQEALNVASDINLVKNKALAGAYTTDGNKVAWGVIFCPGGDTTKYELAPFDLSSPFSRVGGDSVEKELSGNAEFSNCGNGEWVFDRLTGLPLEPLGDDTVELSKSGLSRSITLRANTGRIEFSK